MSSHQTRQRTSLRRSRRTALHGALFVGVLTACGDGSNSAGDAVATGMDPVDVDTPMSPGEARGTAVVAHGPFAADADEELLHEVSVLGQDIEFVGIGSPGAEEQRVLAVTKRPRASVDVIQTLFEVNGPLTMLEVFLAVAPPGSVAHPRLVTSHVTEARALGRIDGAVREVSRPASKGDELEAAEVAKATLRTGAEADCRAALFSPDALNVWTRVSLLPHASTAGQNAGFVCTGGETGTFQAPGTNICTRGFTQPLKVGACAFSDDSSEAVVQAGLALSPTASISFRGPDVLSPNEVFSFVSSGGVTLARMVIVVFPPDGVSSVYLMASGVSEPP
jgi:hypothetical protein